MDVRDLRPGASATCLAGEVRVRIRGLAELYDDAVVEVLGPDGRPWTEHVHRMSGEAVLDTVSTNVSFAVSHRDPGGRFPPGSRAQLVVDLSGRDGSRQQIRSPEVDLSGLRTAELLWVDGGQPNQWTIGAHPVTADPDGEPAGEMVAEDHEIVQVARAAARAQADARRAPRADCRRWVVVLDRSASMLMQYRRGSVAAVLRSLLGAWEVFGDGEPIRVWTAAGGPASIEPLPVDLSREPVDELLSQVYAEVQTGSSMSALIQAVPPSGCPETVFLLTDDLPPDLERATWSLTDPDGSAQLDRHWQVIVFARSRFDFRGAGRRGYRLPPGEDDLRALAAAPGVEITSVAAERTPLPVQLTEPRLMRALVAALTHRQIDLRDPEELR